MIVEFLLGESLSYDILSLSFITRFEGVTWVSRVLVKLSCFFIFENIPYHFLTTVGFYVKQVYIFVKQKNIPDNFLMAMTTLLGDHPFM